MKITFLRIVELFPITLFVPLSICLNLYLGIVADFCFFFFRLIGYFHTIPKYLHVHVSIMKEVKLDFNSINTFFI